LQLFVHEAVKDDFRRDANKERRTASLSRADKYQQLVGIPEPSRSTLIEDFGSIRSDNDLCDVRQLYALKSGAASFLVTEDDRLIRRAIRAGLQDRVFTIASALEWIQRSYEPEKVKLPYVVEKGCHQLQRNDPIFQGLRDDYDGFDAWFTKCVEQHRTAWVIESEGSIQGLVIINEETPRESGINTTGRILKICTFKISEDARGIRLGELLLRKCLWFCQKNNLSLAYMTTFPKQIHLANLVSFFGFKEIGEQNGEKVLARSFSPIPNPAPLNTPPFEYCKSKYPSFDDSEAVQKFIVPIRPVFHTKLFPEATTEKQQSLFSDESLYGTIGEAIPFNAARKVYVCGAAITKISRGDLLFFYMTKHDNYEESQSITYVGVTERAEHIPDVDGVIERIAKRSVFTVDEISQLHQTHSESLLVIEFLAIGRAEPPVSLKSLRQQGVLRAAPQSIMQIDKAKYAGNFPTVHWTL
jgi:predicted GNAT family N-acyltransferase